MFTLPPTYKLPPIPAPFATTNPPVVDDVACSGLVTAKFVVVVVYCTLMLVKLTDVLVLNACGVIDVISTQCLLVPSSSYINKMSVAVSYQRSCTDGPAGALVLEV